MKYQIGEKVYHRLTNEPFIVIGYNFYGRAICRARDYLEYEFLSSELMYEADFIKLFSPPQQ
jgi:hypothetical protein